MATLDKLTGGKMNVLNIKSRREQTSKKYVELLENLLKNDPLVHLQGNKHISMESLYKSEVLEKDGTPKVMYGQLSTYDILDPESFYNRREKEMVEISLDPDIVANLKHEEFYFVPYAHRLVFKSSGKITLNQFEKFFSKAFDIVEGEGAIDVIVVKDRDVISRILSAKEIYTLCASITFSNKDFSKGFIQVFDEKTKEADIHKMDINMVAPQDESLNVEKDGLVEAVVKISESNGSVKAKVRESEGKKRIEIDTKDYPMKIEIRNRKSAFLGEVYSQIMSIFRPEN